MSIFISVPTLVDPEIYNTIESAIANASDPDSVYIGVACITDESFFNVLRYSFPSPNIAIDRYDPRETSGVGKGRTLARKRYDNQDYFLQIDSHTHFMPHWDTVLKNLFNECLVHTGNEKSLLTGYLGRYKFLNGQRITDDGILRYAPFTDNNVFPRGIIGWSDVKISMFPKGRGSNDLFVPSNKVSAGFIFSNKHFPENSGLDEDAIFYDEEIIQSIELISNGFSLVFPNRSIPLRHLYHDDQDNSMPKRQTAMHSGNNQSQRYFKYINNVENFEKIRIWEEYAHANLRIGRGEPWYIPKTFVPLLTEKYAAATI